MMVDKSKRELTDIARGKQFYTFIEMDIVDDIKLLGHCYFFKKINQSLGLSTWGIERFGKTSTMSI